VLLNVVRTALCTKLVPEMANHMIPLLVEAVQLVAVEDRPIDLFMVEIMHM
jgi:T-complex protein 1 subunit zeta